MLNIKSPYNFSDIGRFLIEASLYDYEIPFISCSLLNNIDLFPYIPRILYKDVIIFEEKWILRKRDIQSIEKFNKWRCIWNVPKMVYMEQGDERIILNLDDINDREYLFKKTKEYSSLRKVDLEDKDEVEYVFSFDREDESEKFKKNTLNMSSLSRRNFLIDDEWVYIKCFGISTSIRILISKYLRNFALEMFKKEIIEEFHYLNYYDEDRRSLRVRFKKASKGGLRDINKFFNNLIENNIIQEISINMYSRELERYEFKNNIEVVENIFTMSSMATSYMLINKKFNINNRDDIFYIINSIFILLKILNVNLDLFFFTLDKELEYKTYRREYRRLFINNNQVFQKFSKYLLDNYYEKFESDDLINYYNIMKEFSKYRLSDYSFSMDTILGIVHMQINRLIISNKDEYYIMCIIRHIMHDLRNINYEKFK
ncbi:MAG: thiopeptide-type bacteriocin biosynthesis protein [Helcococcus sp.]|nr:thiopeptide-type bacteriocin biosynthesis protein [Helcococcus sp.]